MGVLFCSVMVWLICKGCKALFRAKPKTRRKDPPVFQDSTTHKNLAQLEMLQSARDTQQQLIDYIGSLLWDTDSEKETVSLLRQKAQAEKQLATIEKQIYKIIAG